MKKYLIILLSILASGCIVEESSISNILVENLTTHSVLITPYKAGAIDSTKLFSLSPGQNKSIGSDEGMGKTIGPVYFGDYFRNLDSIVVLWDNTYRVTHMISDSFVSTGKYISILNERNIAKLSKYKSAKVKETKHFVEWTATYSFTEADYEFAKD